MNSPAGNETRPEPPRDSQYWLGWAAAILVVLILVAVVVLAWRQLMPPVENRAEVAMTPIVGGMVLVTATPTSSAAIVTSTAPATQAVAAAAGVAVTVTLPTTTTGAAAVIATTATMTLPLVTPVMASATPEPTDTSEPPASPTAASTATATVAPTATASPAPTPTPVPTLTPTPVAAMRVVFTPGDRVADGAHRLTVYAHASTVAPVLDAVAEGVALTVLEPSSDYPAYPVVADGHGWVRVRAADGLVGWVMTDTLVRQP